MRLIGFAFLADENIHADIVRFLREEGCDIITADDVHLRGAPDVSILAAAFARNRVVLTHDSDFGALAVSSGQRIVGIIYLRPGHIRSEFTIATVRAVLESRIDVMPPFLMIATRRDNAVRIRIRHLSDDL
ncbi:MAG: DUF5615 family PIN-like protein [Bryobacterales bacterium]|nr:DUF5615 family PIN-like protein [Bryobacterales bacterium]